MRYTDGMNEGFSDHETTGAEAIVPAAKADPYSIYAKTKTEREQLDDRQVRESAFRDLHRPRAVGLKLLIATGSLYGMAIYFTVVFKGLWANGSLSQVSLSFLFGLALAAGAWALYLYLQKLTHFFNASLGILFGLASFVACGSVAAFHLAAPTATPGISIAVISVSAALLTAGLAKLLFRASN